MEVCIKTLFQKWFIALSAAIIIAGCGASPQGSATQQIVWTKQFGTAGGDWADGVSVDTNGNLYVAGTTHGGLDGNTNAGGGDGFLIKYDAAGVKQWTRQFGTASEDQVYYDGVSVDASGNIYVAGGTYGGLDDNANAGQVDGFLVKYDSSGVKQWTRQFGTTSDDWASSIAVDASENIYVVGATGGELDGNTNSGGNDGYIIKYNSSGSKQWTRQVGTASSDQALDISLDTNGNVYVTGNTKGDLDGNSNAGLEDGFLIKYDSSGLKQWTRQFGTTSSDGLYGSFIDIDADGNVYVAGNTEGGMDGNTNAGQVDGLLLKYDSSGVKQWTRQFGTAGQEWTFGIFVDLNGNIYIAGNTQEGLDGNINAGNDDGFVVKYDSSGVKQWTRQFGTVNSDWASGVSVDASGNIYVAGGTGGGLDGNANAGSNDGFLVKYDVNGNKQ